MFFYLPALHLSPSVSLFPQNPFFSPWLCAMWTKTNSAASPLHKRPVFSHLNSFPAFYELLNSTLCYTVWVGAPKVIITQPWCLLHCVCCVTKTVCVCFHVHTCEGKYVFCDGQMRGKSLSLFKWGMFNMCLFLCDTSPCRCCKWCDARVYAVCVCGSVWEDEMKRKLSLEGLYVLLCLCWVSVSIFPWNMNFSTAQYHYESLSQTNTHIYTSLCRCGDTHWHNAYSRPLP